MTNETDITREVFRHIEGTPFYYLFYILFTFEVLLFLYAVTKLFLKYKKGTQDSIQRISFPSFLFKAIKGFFSWSSDEKIDKTDFKVKWAHRTMLIGLFVLLLGTAYITFNQDFPIAVQILFNVKLNINTFYGLFYIVFSFFMDLAGFLAILSVLYLWYRRGTAPPRLDYARADKRELNPVRNKWKREDKFFLFYILFALLVGFFLESLRIVADTMPIYEVTSFVAYPTAVVLQKVISEPTAEILYFYTWWFHFFQSIFFFTVVLPYTKGMHMLTAYLSIITRDPLAGTRLPKKLESNEDYGYRTITDLSWRDLLSLDACTKCGRCHISCPAQTVGHALSPRDLILDLREHAAVTLGSPEYAFRNENTSKKADQLLVLEKENPTILPETIWSCTTCRACVTMCPVAIEHVPLIIQLRRSAIEEGNVDSGIMSVLESVGRYGNSFNKSKRQRSKWTKKLDFKIKDANKEKVEYLWYVGDFASFDDRAFSDSIKVAKILNFAGIDFGILYDKEKTAGNDVRRIGEEGLFEMLVEDNLATLNKADFSNIMTTDPHTLNTLRNEYPDFDEGFHPENILHYTTLLWQLVSEGKLMIRKKFQGTVTFHDPCYLGRYNGEYDAPRNLIKALGYELKDMPRCKENSFCCGAGGGQIWKLDIPKGDRPALNRIREAQTLNPSNFIVACPKDKVMFTDAGKDADFEVVDIISLLYDALEIPEPAKETNEPTEDKS